MCVNTDTSIRFVIPDFIENEYYPHVRKTLHTEEGTIVRIIF